MIALEEPATFGEPIASVCLVGVHHSEYVSEGAETGLPAGQRPSLGGLMLVVDGYGWVTAHRVAALLYRGERGVRFGPRVAWPDGSIAARSADAYAPGWREKVGHG